MEAKVWFHSGKKSTHRMKGVIKHLVDAPPPGAIYNLIAPLHGLHRHRVYSSFCSRHYASALSIESWLRDKGEVLVLHASGRDFPYLNLLMSMPEVEAKLYIFMHVSLRYLEFRGRYRFISRLLDMHSREIINGVLCPSREVAKQYACLGVTSKCVRPGIPSINDTQLDGSDLIKRYRPKLITTCISDDAKYQWVKGIDRFLELNEKIQSVRRSLVAGFYYPSKGQIVDFTRFTPNEFLSVLSRSGFYVQLSRFEAYNISAIYAKRLQVPIILSSVEGHLDNAPSDCLADNVEDAINIINYHGDENPIYISERLAYLRYLSELNESLNRFSERLTMSVL